MNNVLFAPWITLLVLTPLAGAVLTRQRRFNHVARRIGVWTASVTLALSAGLLFEWIGWSDGAVLVDRLDPLRLLGLGSLWRLDAVNVVLLPYAALIGWAVILITPRSERRNGSLSNALAGLACLLGFFASSRPLPMLAFYAAGYVPALLECRLHKEDAEAWRKPFLGYGLAGLLFFAAGAALLARGSAGPVPRLAGALLLAAVLVRKGLVPLHAWMPAFFECAPFRLALLWSTPQAGVYIAVRLLFPYATAFWLSVLIALALLTAVYAAGLALIQDDARRMFGYLFMSQSAIVLTGLHEANPLGVTATLALWLSAGVALTGLGLTLWALEARRGRLVLSRFYGGYEQTPTLAVCFVIMGLTSVGFPGTLGFVGQELLVDAALEGRSFGSIAIMTAIVINSITLLRAYFHLFCGAHPAGNASQRMRMRERVCILVLASLMVLGGLWPQPLIRSRAAAAAALVTAREQNTGIRVSP